MKQIIIGLLMAVVVWPLHAQAAGAATMGLDQSSYGVTRGEFFDVTVSVDPRGEPLDTVRAVVTFDPTVVSVQSVRLSGAFNRVAPGNYYDNATGKISWGAFTLDGPVTTPTAFMTVTFLAIEAGEGNIQISTDSRTISDGNERINTAQLGQATVEVEEARGAEPGVAILAIDSSSHPDQEAWYANRKVDLSWTALGGESPITAYSYSFGLESDADPDIVLPDGTTTQMSLEAPTDGLYYFRLKAIQADGRETPVAERIVRMDMTAPNPIDLTAQDDKILEGESAWFIFATTDETSGVVEYQVAINDSGFQTQVSPLEMEDLPPGTYFFRVAALDRAGNVTYGAVSVRVYPEGTDLSRPEGYGIGAEVQMIAASVQEAVADISGNKRLLITVVLGVIALFGIIYLSRKRKA